MYDLFIDDKQIANGLSPGELNQWLIDLEKELKDEGKKHFRKDLGFTKETKEGFESFLYNNQIEAPKFIQFKDKFLLIMNTKKYFSS